jgi:hypothetical protein
LLNGRHPYSAPTYLGNPITPLPGAIILAIPFVIAKAIWLQNVLWLGGFFLLARNFLRDDRQALLLMWLVTATPAVLHEVAVGGDLLTNGIYVAVALFIGARALAGQTGRWPPIGAGVFLGITFASRLTYPYLFPLVFAFALQITRPGRAVLHSAIAALTFAVLTLPLYLSSPDRFAPLHMRTKVMRVAEVIPRPDIVIPVIAVAGAILLCARLSPDAGRFLWRAAAIVALPTTVLLVASFATPRAPTMEYLSMGLAYLPLAALALAPYAMGNSGSESVGRQH